MNEAATQSAQKRRRMDEGDQAYPIITEMTRDGALWYTDGNVVVGAGTTLFRVHKSVLSKHSAVFEGMFGGPPHSGEEVDGCPFVRLFGDNPMEVRHMLNEMYGLRERKDRKITLELLCALVRLGEKYDVPAMRTEGDNILQELYGRVGLDKFQQRQFAPGLFGNPDPSSRPDFPVAPWRPTYCFDIYVLARDHDMKAIAARALYDCCRWHLVDLKPHVIPALTPDVIWACALGRELLAKRGAEQLRQLDPNHLDNVQLGFFNIPGPSCEVAAKCGPVKERNFDLITCGLAPVRQDPLNEDYRDEFSRRFKDQLCGVCRSKVVRALQQDAQAIWDSLEHILTPAMAGIPV